MKHRGTHTQRTSAAKAGLSERTARRCDRDPRPQSQKKTPRSWRTREDPLADVWDADILPLLEAAPGLKPVTLLEELERRYPDRPWESSRRTLERRIRDWNALEGPDKEVIFRQANPPGRMALSDFTDGGALVTETGLVGLLDALRDWVSADAATRADRVPFDPLRGATGARESALTV